MARKKTATLAIPQAVQTPPFEMMAENGPILTARIRTVDWIDLPDHPRHRNTSYHAGVATHLKLARKAKGAVAHHLSHVVAAYWAGTYYKVDGHTRAYLWERGELSYPEWLHATVYQVTSREELNDLYEVFDTSTANKTTYDHVLAGFRDCDLRLQSRRLRKGFLNDALNIALRGVTRELQKPDTPAVDIYRAIRVFKEELLLLDGIDPQPSPFYSGVVAAALIGLVLFEQASVLSFFDKLNRKQGNRIEGRSDPVDAVLIAIEKMAMEKTAARTTLQGDLCARVLRGLQTWLAGPDSSRHQYWLQYALHAINMEPLLERLKVRKGIENDPAL